MSEQTINFEKSLSELEKIVSLLENGDISLDEAIKLYEKGITLTNQCRNALETARTKIISLSDAEGEADND